MEQKLFETLMESLEQALAYAKGDTSKCTVTVREIPDPIPEKWSGDVTPDA